MNVARLHSRCSKRFSLFLIREDLTATLDVDSDYDISMVQAITTAFPAVDPAIKRDRPERYCPLRLFTF